MLKDEVAKRLASYPLYSQDGVDNPLVGAKLFNALGGGTWYLTEYDPTEQIAFGYVTGLGEDEWGYVSIAEAAEVSLHGVPAIEVDLHFAPTRFKEIRMN